MRGVKVGDDMGVGERLEVGCMLSFPFSLLKRIRGTAAIKIIKRLIKVNLYFPMIDVFLKVAKTKEDVK